MAGVVLTVNGGSSSVKFAIFQEGAPGARPTRMAGGEIERIGLAGTALRIRGPGEAMERHAIAAGDHRAAALEMIGWLRKRPEVSGLAGIGHRVVHGGLHLTAHQEITDAVVAELKAARALDPAHLPREIALIETFRGEFPGVPEVACFDTAFHRELPRVAQLLPIPRRYTEAGVRRFGFHGLSYAYLMEELGRVAGAEAARGRVILAHLGSGASLAAVRGGKPIDTSMAFTPTAGLVMGTRPGDIDGGLLVYIMRREKQSAAEMDTWLNERCGLLGVSETTYDMRDLLAARGKDGRAAEAVELFCYQAKKWIGAYAAALGGVETLVFSGGIGEHAPAVRAEICAGLGFLGVQLDDQQNAAGAGVISSPQSRATVRVLATDEEVMIAASVYGILHKTGDVS